MSDRALITFDLDGVLLDSKMQVVESWSETCRAMSLWPDVDISKRIGIPLEETLTRETSLDDGPDDVVKECVIELFALKRSGTMAENESHSKSYGFFAFETGPEFGEYCILAE